VTAAKSKTYLDEVLASASVRDPDFVELYSSKYQMLPNEISPLFKNKQCKVLESTETDIYFGLSRVE
jgi:hypothetical protein